MFLSLKFSLYIVFSFDDLISVTSLLHYLYLRIFSVKRSDPLFEKKPYMEVSQYYFVCLWKLPLIRLKFAWAYNFAKEWTAGVGKWVIRCQCVKT